eukprot:UN16479
MLRCSPLMAVLVGLRMIPTGTHLKALKLLLNAKANVNAKDVAGFTPLHYVCQNVSPKKTLDYVQCLIDNNGNVNGVNREGTTPLMEACMSNQPHMVACLLEAGADIKSKNLFIMECRQGVWR